MLALCGQTWWRKPENPGKTTEPGRATITLPHALTRIRTRIAVVTSECVIHYAIQAPRLFVFFLLVILVHTFIHFFLFIIFTKIAVLIFSFIFHLSRCIVYVCFFFPSSDHHIGHGGQRFNSCYKSIYEPRHEKTILWGFRPGLTQTNLYSHRTRLEA